MTDGRRTDDKRPCFRCKKSTKLRCGICSTPYCSQLCLDCDEKSHQIFCHAEVEDRLRHIIEYVFSNYQKSRDDRPWILSVGFYNSGMKNFHANLSAFGDTFTNPAVVRCVFCSAVLIEKPAEDLKPCKYSGTVVLYVNCDDCEKMGKKLCSTWLRCTSKCPSVKEWWVFLTSLKKIGVRLPKDIKKILRDLIICHTVGP